MTNDEVIDKLSTIQAASMAREMVEIEQTATIAILDLADKYNITRPTLAANMLTMLAEGLKRTAEDLKKEGEEDERKEREE